MFDIHADVVRAGNRIHEYVRQTPYEPVNGLSDVSSIQVWAKLENLQYTGSFKIRGALNRVLSLTREELERGVVAASSGNHGVGVAFALAATQSRGIVFVPEHASPAKVSLIRRYGTEVRFYGLDSGETELHARAFAEDHGMTYISPYNDTLVIAGQGTVALEMIKLHPRIDVVFVTVGGGALASGVAGYIKAVSPQTRIVGCSPINSPVMVESVKAGHIVDIKMETTIADGTAGGIDHDSITLEPCSELVDEYVLVSEAEIIDAMRLFIDTQHMVLEGAAGVAVAGFRKLQGQYERKTAAIVICGGNIDRPTLKSIL